MDLVTLLGNCQNPGEIELLWITCVVSHIVQVEHEESLRLAAFVDYLVRAINQMGPSFLFRAHGRWLRETDSHSK